jgi:hypothetical protein
VFDSILNILVVCVLPATMAAVGGYLAAKELKRKHERKLYLTLFVTLFVLVLGLSIVWQIRTAHSENKRDEAINELPKKVIAEFIRNNTPPPGYVTRSEGIGPPAPPTGLVAYVDGGLGAAAGNMSAKIQTLLKQEGELPQQKPGEKDVDFLIRSNNWYSAVMAKYHKELAGQVVTMVRILVDHKVLSKDVLELATHPVNVLGIKAVAAQLDGARLKLAPGQDYPGEKASKN